MLVMLADIELGAIKMSFSDEPDKSFGWLKWVGTIVGGILILALAKGVGGLAGRTAVDQFAEGYNETAQEEALVVGMREAQTQLRPQLPIRIDEVTTLNDVIVLGSKITYIMGLSFDVEES